MKTRFGRQMSPPLDEMSSSTSSVASLPSIREHTTWPSPPPKTPLSPETLGPEHYPDWFEWLNVDGAYTMVDHAPDSHVPPVSAAQALTTPPDMFRRSVRGPIKVETTPAIRAMRALQHSKERQALQKQKLSDTFMGRVILELASYPWYRMANGLTAMQFRPGESVWRSNDCANNINWLKSGAYAHRSAANNLLAVVNIERLAPYFAEADAPFFVISTAPVGWPALVPIITYQRLPRFLNDTFKSPRADPDPCTHERQNAGQAAHPWPPAQPNPRP